MFEAVTRQLGSSSSSSRSDDEEQGDPSEARRLESGGQSFSPWHKASSL